MLVASCRRALRARTPRLLARPSGLCPHARQLSGEVAAATGPIALAVEGLAAAQLHTGLPWWAAIGGSAIALRIALLPALWYQLRETRRFVELRPKFALLRAEVRRAENSNPIPSPSPSPSLWARVAASRSMLGGNRQP